MDRPESMRFGRKHEPIDAHISDDLLLLAVDGELSARNATRVRLHLEACWTCRARLEQINDSITGLVEYSNFMIREKFPPSQRGRTNFLKNLHELVENVRRPSVWNRFTGMLALLKGTPQRPIWITAAAMVCMVTLLVATFRATAVVSADEIVRKAEQSQKTLIRAVPRPVIYQKFRIEESSPVKGEAKGAAIERAIYLDPIGRRRMERQEYPEVNAGESGTAWLRNAFESAELDWMNPLSIESFQSWESLHRERAVQVERGEFGLISIRSTLPHGPVAELLLTFRSSDFHPVSENIFFRDLRRIRITEAFFEVFSMNVVDSNMFAPKRDAETNPSAKRAVAANIVPLPSEKEMQAAEMRVRVALHSVRADLGDQLDVRRGPPNTIVVEGVITSRARKEQIQAELQGIENVQTRMTIPREKMASSAESTADAPVVVNDQPLLQSILLAKFPDLDARKMYVDSTLERAQSAMAHAWAVRRLRERYSPAEISRLDPPTRQMLELLIRDHVTAIESEIEAEAGLLKETLPAFPEGFTGARGDCAGEDWRSSAREAFECIEKIQDGASILLAGSQDSQDAESKINEVEETIQILRKQLPNINNQVSGNFLALQANGT